jgi:Na+/phosphate symporter
MSYNINDRYDTYNKLNDKYIPLDERDMMLIQLENAKQKTKSVLLEKHFHIGKKAKENIYLGGVAREYSRFYDELLKQREDQIRALKTLYEHIEDIKETKITALEKKELEKEQRLINKEIDELEKVKKELLNEKIV